MRQAHATSPRVDICAHGIGLMVPARAIPKSVNPKTGAELAPSPTKVTFPEGCNGVPSSLKADELDEPVVSVVVTVAVEVMLTRPEYPLIFALM